MAKKGRSHSNEADLVPDLAIPLPATIVGELIGVPPDRIDHFISLAEGFLGVTDPEQIAEPAAKIYEVFNGLMAERRQQPQDDLMSALLAAEVDGEGLTEYELLGFCFLFLVAGEDADDQPARQRRLTARAASRSTRDAHHQSEHAA